MKMNSGKNGELTLGTPLPEGAGAEDEEELLVEVDGSAILGVVFDGQFRGWR
jgi:hypothetical protein